MPGMNFSRRFVLNAMGCTVAVAPFAGVADAAAADDGFALGAVPASGSTLLHPFAPGARFARWTLAAIGELENGALRVDVRTDDGREFRLEIVARDPSPLAPKPPGATERFGVHVCNGGNGWAPTDEEPGLAAMALASIIAQNEAKVSSAGFLTHAGRVATHRDSLLEHRTSTGASDPTTDPKF